MFSPDSTKVAFVSAADNFGPQDTGRQFWNEDVYLRDLVAGTTTLVSTDASGSDSANDASTQPVFSPDGSSIAFTSWGSNLGPTDTNQCPIQLPPPTPGTLPRGCGDAYLRDLATGTITLLTVNSAGSDSARRGGRVPGPIALWPASALVRRCLRPPPGRRDDFAGVLDAG